MRSTHYFNNQDAGIDELKRLDDLRRLEDGKTLDALVGPGLQSIETTSTAQDLSTYGIVSGMLLGYVSPTEFQVGVGWSYSKNTLGDDIYYRIEVDDVISGVVPAVKSYVFVKPLDDVLESKYDPVTGAEHDFDVRQIGDTDLYLCERTIANLLDAWNQGYVLVGTVDTDGTCAVGDVYTTYFKVGANLANDKVCYANIGNQCITNYNLALGADVTKDPSAPPVNTETIRNSAVTNSKLATNSVSTAKIVGTSGEMDGAVTNVKRQYDKTVWHNSKGLVEVAGIQGFIKVPGSHAGTIALAGTTGSLTPRVDIGGGTASNAVSCWDSYDSSRIYVAFRQDDGATHKLWLAAFDTSWNVVGTPVSVGLDPIVEAYDRIEIVTFKNLERIVVFVCNNATSAHGFFLCFEWSGSVLVEVTQQEADAGCYRLSGLTASTYLDPTHDAFATAFCLGVLFCFNATAGTAPVTKAYNSIFTATGNDNMMVVKAIDSGYLDSVINTPETGYVFVASYILVEDAEGVADNGYTGVLYTDDETLATFNGVATPIANGLEIPRPRCTLTGQKFAFGCNIYSHGFAQFIYEIEYDNSYTDTYKLSYSTEHPRNFCMVTLIGSMTSVGRIFFVREPFLIPFDASNFPVRSGGMVWSHMEDKGYSIPDLSFADATTSAIVVTTDNHIHVNSTTGFTASGTAYIERHVFSYTGLTATSFTGVTGIDIDHREGVKVYQSASSPWPYNTRDEFGSPVLVSTILPSDECFMTSLWGQSIPLAMGTLRSPYVMTLNNKIIVVYHDGAYVKLLSTPW